MARTFYQGSSSDGATQRGRATGAIPMVGQLYIIIPLHYLTAAESGALIIPRDQTPRGNTEPLGGLFRVLSDGDTNGSLGLALSGVMTR